MEVVYEALGRNGPDCNNAITAAIEELEKMMAENNFEGLEGKAEKKISIFVFKMCNISFQFLHLHMDIFSHFDFCH